MKSGVMSHNQGRPFAAPGYVRHVPAIVLLLFYVGFSLAAYPGLVQARPRPRSALLCMGRPFHPAFTDLGIAPSPHLVKRVSFLFRSQPSPVTLLSVMHPAVREELPQEVPVAHAPARVEPS